MLAVVAKGEWWEVVAALFTPATLVCGYMARKARQLGNHLERQDRRAIEHGERLSRVEGALGLPPRKKS